MPRQRILASSALRSSPSSSRAELSVSFPLCNRHPLFTLPQHLDKQHNKHHPTNTNTTNTSLLGLFTMLLVLQLVKHHTEHHQLFTSLHNAFHPEQTNIHRTMHNNEHQYKTNSWKASLIWKQHKTN